MALDRAASGRGGLLRLTLVAAVREFAELVDQQGGLDDQAEQDAEQALAVRKGGRQRLDLLTISSTSPTDRTAL